LFKNIKVTTYPHKAIWLMINMLALPQIILAYIMLDVSFYALHETHIMLPWLFTLIALVVGSILLIILFIQATKSITENSLIRSLSLTEILDKGKMEKSFHCPDGVVYISQQ